MCWIPCSTKKWAFDINCNSGSSYIELLGWISVRKAIINRKKEDEESFKWSVIAFLHHKEIGAHPDNRLSITYPSSRITTRVSRSTCSTLRTDKSTPCNDQSTTTSSLSGDFTKDIILAPPASRFLPSCM